MIDVAALPFQAATAVYPINQLGHHVLGQRPARDT